MIFPKLKKKISSIFSKSFWVNIIRILRNSFIFFPNFSKISGNFFRKFCKIWTKYFQNLDKIFLKFGQDISKIWTKYFQNLNKIFPKFGQNISIIWTKYFQHISKISFYFLRLFLKISVRFLKFFLKFLSNSINIFVRCTFLCEFLIRRPRKIFAPIKTSFEFEKKKAYHWKLNFKEAMSTSLEPGVLYLWTIRCRLCATLIFVFLSFVSYSLFRRIMENGLMHMCLRVHTPSLRKFACLWKIYEEKILKFPAV